MGGYNFSLKNKGILTVGSLTTTKNSLAVRTAKRQVSA